MQTSDNIVLVGPAGITLFQKELFGKFSETVSALWSSGPVDQVVNSVVSMLPLDQFFDVVLDDQLTQYTCSAGLRRQMDPSIVQDDTIVTVTFNDVLKKSGCEIVCERAHLDEVINVFSMYFKRLPRIILRNPSTEFRYMVLIDTSALMSGPDRLKRAILATLSVSLIKLEASIAEAAPAPLPVAEPERSNVIDLVPAVVRAPSEPLPPNPAPADAPGDLVGMGVATATTDSPADVQAVTATDVPLKVVHSVPDVTPPSDLNARPTEMRDDAVGSDPSEDGDCIFVFSFTDSAQTSVLAAGCAWTAPKDHVQTMEIGAFRKKLPSEFNKLVGVADVFETDVLPVPAARLRDLETAIAARLGTAGRQVIYFGSEVLGPEMLSMIRRLVLHSSRNISVVVCEDGSDTSQFDDLIKTAFDGIANKYQIYSDAAIGGRSVSFKDDHGWAEFCLPHLDTAIVKKLLAGNSGSFFKGAEMTGGLLPRELHDLNRWLVAYRALPFTQRAETPAVFRSAPAISRVVSF